MVLGWPWARTASKSGCVHITVLSCWVWYGRRRVIVTVKKDRVFGLNGCWRMISACEFLCFLTLRLDFFFPILITIFHHSRAGRDLSNNKEKDNHLHMTWFDIIYFLISLFILRLMAINNHLHPKSKQPLFLPFGLNSIELVLHEVVQNRYSVFEMPVVFFWNNNYHPRHEGRDSAAGSCSFPSPFLISRLSVGGKSKHVTANPPEHASFSPEVNPRCL